MGALAYILKSLTAAWRLVLRDPDGMKEFDLTLSGFWLSFSAALVAAPLYLMLLLMEHQLLPEAPPAGDYLAIKAVSYAVSWVAYPLLMVPVARALGLGHAYTGFIIAYNWSAVIIMLILLPPFALYAVQGISAGAAGFLNLMATFAVLYYRWFLTRTALATTGGLALGLVVIDLLLSVVIDMAGNRLLGL